jgi:hypothetical protein
MNVRVSKERSTFSALRLGDLFAFTRRGDVYQKGRDGSVFNVTSPSGPGEAMRVEATRMVYTVDAWTAP